MGRQQGIRCERIAQRLYGAHQSSMRVRTSRAVGDDMDGVVTRKEG